MKKVFSNVNLSIWQIVTLFAVFAYLNVSGQGDNLNYYKYIQMRADYFKKIQDQLDPGETPPGYKGFNRYKDFWNTRVSNSAEEPGGYDTYFTKMEQYKNNPSLLPQTDNSVEWGYVGPKDLQTHNKGFIMSLWVNPNNIDNIYAGSNSAGMYKTTDGGLNWHNITDNILQPGMGIQDIAVNPQDTDVKYIATGNGRHDYGVGVFKTDNDGASWTQVLSFIAKNKVMVRKLLIDDQNPNILYALADRKLYRTTNAGNTWEVIFDDLDINNVTHWASGEANLIDIEFKPNDHNTLFISSTAIKSDLNLTEDMSAELWTTNNANAPAGSVTWTRITSGLPDYIQRIELATTEQNTSNMLFSYTDGEGGYSYYLKSLNYNTLLSTPVFDISEYSSYYFMFGGIGYFRNELEFSPEDPEVVYIGGFNLAKLDLNTLQYEGYTVTAAPHPFFHVDQRCFKLAVSNGTTYLFAANDGGVSRYNCNTKEMESLNSNSLNNNQYWGIGSSELAPDFYIGGLQDNGIIGNLNHDTWKYTMLGDGYDIAIDPVEPKLVYATYASPTKRVGYSTDYGNSFSSCIGTPVGDGIGIGHRPLKMNKNRDLFVGYDEVYIKPSSSLKEFAQYSSIQGLPGECGDQISAIGISDNNTNVMYVGYNGPIAWGGDSKFFKTTDDGQNWIDITGPIADHVLWHPITDIYVNPDDENELWLTLSSYANNQVIHSTDSGQNWTNISNGLPSLPINCINAINLNNKMNILVGNDLGVFMYDSQTSQWLSVSNNLPPVMVSDIEVNYSSGEIRLATYGRGIWKGSIDCANTMPDLSLSSNTIWDTDQVFSQNVVVESGVTLTINATISFGENARIIVKTGGTLVVDGGKLTNSCEGFWPGIEVNGDDNLSQFPYANQGRIQLKNRAIIEHAVVGIKTYKETTIQSERVSYAGGIIHASEATFKNCETSVHFLEYDEINSSYFNDCNFICDEIIEPYTPEYMVKLNGVRGVTFKNCDFINATSVDYYGDGMFINNSMVKLEGTCQNTTIPCENFDNGSFSNFRYAIYAVNSNPSRYVIIKNQDFSECYSGIYMSGYDGSTIISNSFIVPEAMIGIDHSYGAYLESCTRYHIEDNEFDGISKQDGAVGLYIVNSGGDYNSVYNNKYKNLYAGIAARGENRNGVSTGLCIKCNDFEACNSDITILKEDGVLNNNTGIAYNQGTMMQHDTAASGNTFSLNAQFNIYNEAKLINYVYHNINSATELIYPENIYNPSTIIRQENYYSHYDKQISCPSHLYSSTSVSHEMSKMAAAEAEATELEGTLMTLVDGGSTPLLDAEVQTAFPDEGMEVRDELLTESPYLSEQVMKSTVEREDMMANAMVRDVLVENPQSAKSQEVMSSLEDRAEPMPGYMMDQIMAGTEVVGTIEQLERDLSEYKTERAESFNKVYMHYKLNDNFDAMVAFLNEEPTINAKYTLSFLYFDNGQGAEAQEAMNEIAGMFSMSDTEYAEYLRYKQLLNALIDIEASELSINTLDELHIEQLEDIASNTTDNPGVFARNMLISTGQYTYEEEVVLPDYDMDKSQLVPGVTKGGANVPLLLVHPNPAKDYVIAEYNTHGSEDMKLQIINMNASVIEEYRLEGQNQMVIDLTSYQTGVYVFKLTERNVVIETHKVSVIK